MTKSMIVTSSIAKDLLNYNLDNRRIRKEKVSHYARQMKEGTWKSNTHEYVKIATSGRILDGQHRLHAVIEANVPVELQFVFNCDESIFDVIDSGLNRNAGDVFHIQGIKNGNSIPSIINVYNDFKNDRLYSGEKRPIKMTSADLKEEYLKRPDFWQNVHSLAHQNYVAFSKILNKSLIGGLYAFWYDRYPEKSLEFITQLCTGANITNNSINLLRNKLILDKVSQKKIPVKVRNSLIIKTWNYFIKNQTVKIMKIDMSTETVKSL
jgi:hypothetical protein